MTLLQEVYERSAGGRGRRICGLGGLMPALMRTGKINYQRERSEYRTEWPPHGDLPARVDARLYIPLYLPTKVKYWEELVRFADNQDFHQQRNCDLITSHDWNYDQHFRQNAESRSSGVVRDFTSTGRFFSFINWAFPSQVSNPDVRS